MDRKSRILFKEWLFIIVGWVIILYFLVFITYWGLRHLMKESALTEYLDTGYVHLEIFMTAIIFGSLFLVINTFTDSSRMRKKSFGAIIAIRSFLYLVAFACAAIIIYTVYSTFNLFSADQWNRTFIYFTPLYSVSIISYFVLAILFMNFIQQVSRKFGPGNLLKLITGKYSKPKIEKRIFMFLDLKGSTAIAESLGHQKYSELMQHCFHDLTDIVIKYRASIYQYVGDEVVLSWDIKNGLKDLNCIKTYFSFYNKLQNKKDYYLNRYGILPFFKCGMDCGEVTVAEIGEIKREIAYHGDVLNTAARIEKKCTPLNKMMIISEYLEKDLPKDLDGFTKEPIEDIELRGKSEKVALFSIHQNGK